MKSIRIFRSIKSLIYLVGIVSLFAVVVNINELNKPTLHTAKFRPYDRLDTLPGVSGSKTETISEHNLAYILKRLNITTETAALNNITKLLNDLKNVNSNARKPKEANEFKNVSDGSEHPLNVEKTTRKVENVPSKLSNNVVNSGIRSVTHTAQEFRRKAKEDKQLLMKILSQPYLHPKSKDVLNRYFTGANYSFENEFKSTFKDNLRNNFDIRNDVMVFLHIQKTGGMRLNDRFLRELQIPFRCNCQPKVQPCKCLNPQGNSWIYTSKFSGWPCGLHADWTQLHTCLPGFIDGLEGKTRNRRYFYFTQLRDPISRYISEYFHQSVRGGHWQDALLGCGPGYSDWSDIRPCFHTESWKGVTLENFMACPHNLATNRMTRMLADLTQSDCYRKYLDKSMMQTRAVKWVESAKENLQQMEFFGFMEDTEASDRLFSNVFKMHFKSRRAGVPMQSSNVRMTEEQYLKILKLVELDLHINLFAKDLFAKRLGNA